MYILKLRSTKFVYFTKHLVAAFLWFKVPMNLIFLLHYAKELLKP